MKRVGLIGWRGMVGSVLLQRMIEEQDFDLIEPLFFTTSKNIINKPNIGKYIDSIYNAYNIDTLKTLDIILTCRGSNYTNKVFFKLRKSGWNGYWIDSANNLRMEDNSLIILDPVNKKCIDHSLDIGIKNFIGGNCTVSLLLMALGGLFDTNLVEWMTTTTYQAASGAGAKSIYEFLQQLNAIHKSINKELNIKELNIPANAILDIERKIKITLNSSNFPKKYFNVPLITNLIPWIDNELPNGQSYEEWRAQSETNKILSRSTNPIPVDGICVRIGSMRCHSQAIMIKLNKDISINEIENIIKSHNKWVNLIPNNREYSINYLTPAAVSGTLNISIGRLRKLNMGSQYLGAFTVGDQLLWGAAEPLRRMLRILLEY